jgi:periplasmic divalent cation tolerance protein
MSIVIFITTSSIQEAQKIAEHLVAVHLVACVNIIESVQSVFWWENKVDRANESLVIVKTMKKNFKKIVKAVKSFHSYSVPEIIALPIIDGNPDYMKWIKDSVA